MSNLVERWPGYGEQSWSQRFAELDRRYHADRQNSIKALLELHEARVAIESRVRAEERERAARIAEEYVDPSLADNRDVTIAATSARASIDIAAAIRNGEG